MSTSTFNLLENSDLDLERAYQGLLIMGSELTTQFSVFAEPGHASTFSISPPDYAAIVGVDSNGSIQPQHVCLQLALANGRSTTSTQA